MIQDAKPHKGVPDFVSKEDLVCKIAILQNTIHQIVRIKAEPKDHEALGKYRRYIYNNAIQINKDCIFAGKQLSEYLEKEEWVMLHTMLELYRPKLALLYKELNTLLSKLFKKLMIHVGCESSRQWKVYVDECLKKGGGRMFHNIAIEDKAYLSVANEHLGTYRHSPKQHLEHQANTWSSRWHRASDIINKGIKHMLRTIVNLAKRGTEIDNTFDTDKYDKGLKGYKKNTRGIDTWTSTELSSLPKEGKVLMADGMEKPLKKMAQPIQNLINLNAMLGKPSEATRTVCKTPMLYRITLRSRNNVAEWEDEETGDFDTPGKGKSALIAAAYRGLQAEIYKYTDEQVIGVFHDFEKIFDTIDLEILMQKTIEHNFPIVDLAYTMQQHTAPRIIQCDGFCSRTIITNASILAGGKHSVALTRLLFLTGMNSYL